MIELKWIDGLEKGRLIVVPRPPGGHWLQTEIQRWNAMGVQTVASMLTYEEVFGYGLTREADLCMILGLEYLNFPIKDHSVPESKKDMLEFAKRLVKLLEDDKSVLIHCFAGMGRSVLMAACVLILRGMEPGKACDAISIARGIPGLPETPEQRAWIVTFAETVEKNRNT
jgi:protein-tyrosine phosphatase